MRFSRLIRLLPKCFGRNGYFNRRGEIFLVSHMRAYSTLLGHLIGSHPNVAGYAELHQNYRNSLDFIEQARKIEDLGANPPAGRHLFDKILHSLTIRDNILSRDDLSILVAVRPPLATLSSIIEGQHGGYRTLKDAGRYYLDRLARIRAIIEQRRGRVLYMDADAILDSPDETLGIISEYLGLTPALASTYRTFPMTGQAKYGDSSKWIHSGRVVQSRNKHVLDQALSYFSQIESVYTEFRGFALRNAEKSITCRHLTEATDSGTRPESSGFPERRVSFR